MCSFFIYLFYDVMLFLEIIPFKKHMNYLNTLILYYFLHYYVNINILIEYIVNYMITLFLFYSIQDNFIISLIFL